MSDNEAEETFGEEETEDAGGEEGEEEVLGEEEEKLGEEEEVEEEEVFTNRKTFEKKKGGGLMLSHSHSQSGYYKMTFRGIFRRNMWLNKLNLTYSNGLLKEKLKLNIT
jgi:hypothetical protein